jgi:Mrp family chromosome partitioning ATPase
VLIAALGMLALSVGYVLSGELLNAASVRPLAPPMPGSDAAAPARVRVDDPRAAAGVPLAAIEDLARAFASEGTRRVAVIGTKRSMNTPLVAITLARTLARKARVVLVDLALGAPSLMVIAADRNAPGIGDLAGGAATFGQIITRDRYSSVHVVTTGRAVPDAADVIGSQRLAITIEALARSYDHVVLITDALPEIAADRVARLAPHALLVADEPNDPAASVARTQLLAAGFADVNVVAGNEPQADQKRAAA